MRRGARLPGLVLPFMMAATAAGGWLEVWQADERLDLATARTLALDAMTQEPAGAEGVAAAMWWLANHESLPAPEEPLALVGRGRDPELGFVLERLEAALAAIPPDGALDPAEIAGPFGVFSVLDLERAVVPADLDLPGLGRGWREPAVPYRLTIGSVDGFHGPPVSMAADGVTLVAWTLEAEADLEGWLVVEARGSFNLELDGRPADRRRDCGLADPATTWYHIELARGLHRLRLEIAGRTLPRVRVSLVDAEGAALAGVGLGTGAAPAASPASSSIVRRDPPAAAALERLLEDGSGGVRELLLAARLASARGDPERERARLGRARELEPGDPWVALALARSLLAEGGGTAVGERARRLAQLLREAAGPPGAELLARALAAREGRVEDAERMLDALVAEHPDDPRVLAARVRDAVERGWPREAEEALQSLEIALPGSTAVTALRLEVLAALERWQERDRLLAALAASPAAGLRWIGDLASACRLADATGVVERVRGRVANPDLDLQAIQLAAESGDLSRGRALLETVRRRWGDLSALDELALVLADGDQHSVEEALAAALLRHPSNLQLLTLAWRQGDAPFWEPFVVDAEAFAAEHRDFATDVDVALLLDQAVERIHSDGSSLYYYHGLSRANTPVGARRAAVLQPLPEAWLLKVRIHKADGSIVVPANLQAGDERIELLGVEPGDVVEEEYVAAVGATGASRRGHLPPYLYRFADPDRAFGLSEYVLLVPPELELQVDGNFAGLERSEGELGGLRLQRWRAERVPPMAVEPFAPPAQELVPWLNYGFGVSWQDVGDIFRDRLLPALRASPELRAWGSTALAGETAEEQLRSLVAATVATIEDAQGGIDPASSAADVFATRSGDRFKVIAAVLTAAGWQVDLVLTRAWNERDRYLAVPTLDAFPAAVMRVARGGEELWLDVREEQRGVNALSPLFQGADGLVLPLSEPRRPVELLDRVPTFDNPEQVERVRVRAEVAADGEARIVFHMPLRGDEAVELEERVESVPAEQAAMLYRQMANSLFAGADEVRGVIERGDDGPAVRLELRAPHACEPEGDEMVCRSLVLARPLVPVLATLPARTHPLVMRLPVERRLELELVPPPGWRVAERPPRRLEAAWGSVLETLSAANGAQRSELSIVLPAQTVEVAGYRAFARFCQAVDELATRPPRLQRASREPI